MNDSENDSKNVDALMVGTSPGTNDHLCERIPVDAVLYLSAFQKRITALGVPGFVLINRRPEDPSITKEVSAHVSQLRSLAKMVAPGAIVLGPDEINQHGLLPEGGFNTPDQATCEEYQEWQTAQVWRVCTQLPSLLKQPSPGDNSANSSSQSLTLEKFGWRINGGNGRLDEQSFDEHFTQVHPRAPVRFSYTGSGRNNTGGASSPYLERKSNAPNRIFIPRNAEQVHRELKKIVVGISSSTYTQILRVSGVIFDREGLDAAANTVFDAALGETPRQVTDAAFLNILQLILLRCFRRLAPDAMTQYDEHEPEPVTPYG